MISLIGKAVSIIRREGFSSFFSRFANYIKWLIGHCAVQVLWENAYGHLEHLLNPYKHLCDLLSMLTQEGYLIIQTVCPGYPYHRYPVDTLRFYPDWFEEVGKRLKLTVIHRRVKNNNIFYMYQL
jgi:hypothetical protein